MAGRVDIGAGVDSDISEPAVAEQLGQLAADQHVGIVRTVRGMDDSREAVPSWWGG